MFKSNERIIIVSVIVVFGLTFFIAWRFSESPATVSSTGARFRTKPENVREGAKALVSKLAPENKDAKTGAGAGQPLDSWSAPENVVEQQRGFATNGDELREEALAAPSPQAGVEMVNKALANARSKSESSQLYSTLAKLEAQSNPANYAAVDRALANAEALAETAEDRHEAGLAKAQILLNRGDRAQALEALNHALAQGDAVTEAGLRARVLRANLYEETGDTARAVAEYQKSIEDASKSAPTLGLDAANVYRQACLRLSRLYRQQGNEKEAEKLARRMKLDLRDFDNP